MGTKLTDKDLKDVSEAFASCSKDGGLPSDKVVIVLRVLKQNPTNEEVKNMISKYDKNKNGIIELEEFKEMYVAERQTPENIDKAMRAAFQVFDKEGKGSIDAVKLKKVLTSMGEKLTNEEADQLIKEADKNKDGKIDYEEYKSTMLDF